MCKRSVRESHVEEDETDVVVQKPVVQLERVEHLDRFNASL